MIAEKEMMLDNLRSEVVSISCKVEEANAVAKSEQEMIARFSLASIQNRRMPILPRNSVRCKVKSPDYARQVSKKETLLIPKERTCGSVSEQLKRKDGRRMKKLHG